MTVKMDGIPYADVFCVEIRWVATRLDAHDLRLESGIFVDFKKSSMLKKTIRDGTIKETTPANLDLLQKIKQICQKNKTESQDMADDDDNFPDKEDMQDKEKEVKKKTLNAFAQMLSLLLAKLKPVLETVTLPLQDLQDPRDLVIAFCLFVLFLYLLWPRSSHHTSNILPQSISSKHDASAHFPQFNSHNLKEFSTKIDSLCEEMKGVRLLLEEMLAIMKNQQESVVAAQEL